ncbi:MAG TPA: ABC-F family ATP-binding cassette domain-containing protein [Candidatus Wallbacteria bacterium]|nr:ABC-F family ATP-binding cassette domain-containing protein [Candidatus Wallbacteria bacterium]
MPLITFNKVSITFGTFDILKNLSFILRENSKTGLIGPNGSGKTTIVKLLKNELSPDSGEIMKMRDIRIGYVMQEIKSGEDEVTLVEFIKKDFQDIFALERRINELENEISKMGRESSGRTHAKLSAGENALMEEYSKSTEEYSRHNGYALMARIRSMLAGLGFVPEEYDKPLRLFSGGMKTRAQLCKLLLKEYDLIVLDEPTNYLDTNSLEFLENFLKTSPVAALVISHDRYFLDEVCDHMLYLYNKQAEEFPGNYTDFTEIFELRQNQRVDEYEKQQEFIKKTEEFYLKYKAGIKCKMARGRKKFIDRMERLDNPDISHKTINLDFSSNMSDESGRVVASAENISKSFGDKKLFSNGSFEIGRGSIVGIIGSNGTGKTTLLKMINGEDENYGGRLTIGHNVKIGYQDQLLSSVDAENRVIDEIWNMKKMMLEGEVRKYLAKFLFSGDDVFKKVKSLSGGEKSRLILSKIIMGGANTLILDEPTNHLDIPSKEMLESALVNFDGTVIFVSHDRYFIDKVANGLIAIQDGKLEYYNGNYSYFREKREERKKRMDEATAEKNRKQDTRQAAVQGAEIKKTLSKNAERIIRQEIDQAEAEISRTEARIGEIEKIFSENSVNGHNLTFEETEKFNGEYQALKELNSSLYEKWHRLNDSIES